LQCKKHAQREKRIFLSADFRYFRTIRIGTTSASGPVALAFGRPLLYKSLSCDGHPDPEGQVWRRKSMNGQRQGNRVVGGPRASRASYMVAAGERGREFTPGELLQLLGQVAESRDRQAFAALFRFYGPRLKSFLIKQGFSDIESEDLVQEAMLNLWRKADSFDASKAGVSTWVFTIARNCGIDRRRRAGRVTMAPAEEGAEEQDPDPSAEERLIVGEDEAAVRAALGRLPAEQAAVIRLSFFAENPQAEIARSLGIPLGTVKSRVRLALQRLRQIMEDR
jgi:RNA polymerase sigma-70 factor (ECF subfamily)